MIVDHGDREDRESGVTERASFGISSGDEVHLLTLLRDTLYSDKVMAVLREYGANARDAHHDPRCPDKRGTPIRVQVPTLAEPTLAVQDFGPGLSHDEVFRVFTQYGASTKRGSNDAVGYMGVGSKSGFAYSDSFTVVSRHGGRCRTYAAVLDASERGEVRLLGDDPCAPGETGLTVQVGVRPADVAEFARKAAAAFAHYRPRPTINVDLPDVPDGDAVLVGEGAGWTAVMGGVPYAVDLGQFSAPDYVREVGGVAHFAVGDLRVSASREALKYDDRTKAALADRLSAVVERHARSLVGAAAGLTPWGRRLRFAGMRVFAPLLRGVVGEGEFDERVWLPKQDAARLRLVKFDHVPVSPRTRLVFVDDARALGGYGLGHGDLVVRRGTAATHAESWDALRELVVAAGVDGVPVAKTSGLPWTRPPSTGFGGSRVKGECFRLRPDYDSRKRGALSGRWTAVERVANEGDVYVVLDRFMAPAFYETWEADRRLARLLGFDLPAVYGYRVGGDAPPGTPYGEWAAGLYDIAVAARPEVAALVAALPYVSVQHRAESVRQVAAALGAGHPVAAVAARVAAARVLERRSAEGLVDAARFLACRMGRGESTRPDMEAVERDYPLLAGGWEHVLTKDPRDWCDYVAAMDLARSRAAGDAGTKTDTNTDTREAA